MVSGSDMAEIFGFFAAVAGLGAAYGVIVLRPVAKPPAKKTVQLKVRGKNGVETYAIYPFERLNSAIEDAKQYPGTSVESDSGTIYFPKP